MNLMYEEERNDYPGESGQPSLIKSPRGKLIVSGILMLLGGALVITSMAYLLGNLRDSVIYGVGVPGIIAGLILLVTGSRMIHRTR